LKLRNQINLPCIYLPALLYQSTKSHRSALTGEQAEQKILFFSTRKFVSQKGWFGVHVLNEEDWVHRFPVGHKNY
jgi:hypothetical protein